MKKLSTKSKAVLEGILDFIKETGEQNLLGEITNSLEKELAKTRGTDEIIVTSTVLLSPPQLKKIKNTLQKNLKVNLPVVNKIDKTLIAGFTIRVNDWYLDSSVRQALESVKRNLLA